MGSTGDIALDALKADVIPRLVVLGEEHDEEKAKRVVEALQTRLDDVTHGIARLGARIQQLTREKDALVGENRELRAENARLIEQLTAEREQARLAGVLTPSLPVLTAEVLVRSHVHARVWAGTGSPVLDHAHDTLCSELLVTAHALVGAASLGVTAGHVVAGTGPLALGHLNVPVRVRSGALALDVAGRGHQRRRAAAPTWDALLGGSAEPWQLDVVAEIEDELAASG